MRATHFTALASLAVATVLSGQIEFHGHVNPLIRVTTDSRYLSLPHRFIQLDGERSGERVSFYFSTTMEYRLDSDVTTFDMQELYAEFSTDLGDFRFGKQTLAWGVTDGNNPTDNVNPYNYYYLFLPGSDRKVGVVAASANLYFGNISVEAVVTPVFQPSILPIGEPDFPIFGDGPPLRLGRPVKPTRTLENTEAGIRVSIPMALMDLSFSYFSGIDHNFSVIPELILDRILYPNSLGYHRTQVFGYDLVTFISDFALRVEGAYFLTEDPDADDGFIRNPYFQYVAQVDYAGSAGNYMAQYLGTYITGIDGDEVFDFARFSTISEKENEKNVIGAKMGMPFAAIAQNAVMASGSVELGEGSYTVRAQTLYDLDKKGYMLGGGISFHIEDAFDLDLTLSIFGGDEASRLGALKDFSHLSISIKYSF
ncbi:MAG: hypothetical protein IIA59_03625 [Candidatus Marinimicrobia bacterium]|nr:hypothetical protein [Candidatus Neomarinimicrobiota bacterium]